MNNVENSNKEQFNQEKTEFNKQKQRDEAPDLQKVEKPEILDI